MNAIPVILLLQKQQMVLTEEEMSSYSNNDLDDDWEFKIVRAAAPIFHKPEILQQLMKEEARAGWIMLEKFDNSRVRFKRRRQEHKRDEQLLHVGVDPYRTYFGKPPNQAKIIQMIILTLATIVILSSMVGLIIGLMALW